MAACRRIKRLITRKTIFTSLLLILSLYTISSFTPTARTVKPCNITALDPWDKSLKPFLVKPKPLVCSNRKPLMFVNGTGYIHLNNSRLQEYSISSIRCVYRIVTRVEGDQEVTFGSEVQLIPPLFINGRVFRVICQDSSGKTVYDYLHLNAFWNESDKRESEIEEEHGDQMSIIMFGIDSVSRSHALRNLPKSYKYLEEEFGVYDFHGYSKVGENTWPNLVPLLTGQSHRSFPLIGTLRFHCDEMPLLWNEKGIKKFITSFSEDRPDISTFNYIKSGFRYSPTDYYFRPYTLAMTKFVPIIVEPLGKITWDCFGSNNFFQHQIDYLKAYLTKYKNKLKFAYFWNNQVGHEDFTTLSRGDEQFLAFLKWMQKTNQTQNSIFMVLSDHGYRIGGASLTHAGRAENNKPLLLLHVPKHIKHRYPWVHKALDSNTKRLVSHYDTYQTVLDLIKGKAFNQEPPSKVKQHLVRRNIFSPIPLDRTCMDAGIEDKYCTCNERRIIPTTSELVHEIAMKLVESINGILSDHKVKCAMVSLHNVSEASVSYSNSDAENVPTANDRSATISIMSSIVKYVLPVNNANDRTGRYVLMLFTTPGYAYFEGTADFAEIAPNGERNQITVVGEPSRLDRYGNQSHCMNDSFLRLYCYCKDLLR